MNKNDTKSLILCSEKIKRSVLQQNTQLEGVGKKFLAKLDNENDEQNKVRLDRFTRAANAIVSVPTASLFDTIPEGMDKLELLSCSPSIDTLRAFFNTSDLLIGYALLVIVALEEKDMIFTP